jgi:hypothetical protein
MRQEWDDTWEEMLEYYGSDEFKAARRTDGVAVD